ncbi:sulfotransferase [Microbaculum marinum]|uniref:Sulfotransferase n=1 Tax=Microbaculum marinum TaxID=1764581 RepID=A0AAW9RLP9_9HYPH
MIFITGCARSGTSLTAKILRAHGCWLGEPAEVNVLYENVVVRDGILKPYLRWVGADPLGQGVLPDTDLLPLKPGFQEAIAEVFAGKPEPHAYKDAKIALVWQAFAFAYPEAKWVLVRRVAEKIIDSCVRTPFMAAHGSDRRAWARWVFEHERRFDRMKATGLDLIETWPADYIRDPEAFRPVAEHCGLEFKSASVEAAVDRGVWHG